MVSGKSNKIILTVIIIAAVSITLFFFSQDIDLPDREGEEDEELDIEPIDIGEKEPKFADIEVEEGTYKIEDGLFQTENAVVSLHTDVEIINMDQRNYHISLFIDDSETPTFTSSIDPEDNMSWFIRNDGKHEFVSGDLDNEMVLEIE